MSKMNFYMHQYTSSTKTFWSG